MKQERSEVSESYDILATSARADERTRVIKQGDSFGVFDHAGMIRQAGIGELGLYHDGTRHLSVFEIALERRQPLLLSSTVLRENVLNVDLANPDLPDRNETLPRDTVHLFVQSFLWDRAWHARLDVQSYGVAPTTLELSLLVDADFADIFEVRGIKRLRRGRPLPTTVAQDELTFGYEGLDGVVRDTCVAFTPAPTRLVAGRASYALELRGHTHVSIDLWASFRQGGTARPARPPFPVALDRAHEEVARRHRRGGRVRASQAKIDEWLARSEGDFQMMVTDTAYGPYPYAGVPWYSTPFGRDGIISAYELLWLDPEPARGVLGFLAATQATALDPENDAEPGKIIHEMRGGEMAALGEVPFGRYYGSVDATPLFVMLADAYDRRTADLPFLASLWPSVAAALAWIDEWGDLDGDGFVEYARRTPRGLVSQGWKDSRDSISHADGTLATGPIALCEVQAYAYAARRGGARLARRLGMDARAHELDAAAELLRDRFERAFWCEDLGSYALALDGAKRPCRVRASNAGHCLFAGIASAEHADRVVATLLDERMFSGWGIRTLGVGEERYNPISYHNGSVWPHDNAMIAAGMARYGHKQACARVLNALYDASLYFELRRTPELFCGFRPRPNEGPTSYPVACAPQAWAAGGVFLLLQACLGIDIDAQRGELVFDRPVLPAAIGAIAIEGLEIGDSHIDLVLEHRADDIGLHLVRREGNAAVLVRK